VNWSDLPGDPSVPPGRTSGKTEGLILQVRRELGELCEFESILNILSEYVSR